MTEIQLKNHHLGNARTCPQPHAEVGTPELCPHRLITRQRRGRCAYTPDLWTTLVSGSAEVDGGPAAFRDSAAPRESMTRVAGAACGRPARGAVMGRRVASGQRSSPSA